MAGKEKRQFSFLAVASAQAQAQLKVAQAALNLAEVTYRRSQDLFERNVIAGEDFDTAADTYRENQAMVRQIRRISISLKRPKNSKSSRHRSTVLSRRETPILETTSRRAPAPSSFGCSRLHRYAFISTCLRILPTRAVFLANIDSPIRSEPSYLPSAYRDGRDGLNRMFEVGRRRNQ
jgi:ABC-type anion transport system duplicated permease subunit